VNPVRDPVPPTHAFSVRSASRKATALGVLLATRLVHSDGHVKVKTIIGHDHVARGVTAGGGPALLPPTRLAPTSSDRLVAALVIMIQQANRNGRPAAGTLAPSTTMRIV